jgi:hypothetical protein
MSVPEPKKEEKSEYERYFMSPSVVYIKRISGATSEVKGPWKDPFYVDDESFKKKFSILY